MRTVVWAGVLSVVFAIVAPVHADEGSFSAGAGKTASKPQSKLWHNESWWGVLFDGSSHQIQRLDANTFNPILSVDTRASAQADVLWNGTHLFVLMAHSSEPRLYKYTYDSAGGGTYTLLSGFPVVVPVGGERDSMTFTQDSTGKAWIASIDGGSVRVTWSTSADHTSWSSSGFALAGGVSGSDIAASTAFGGNRIGVFWSDIGSDDFRFRTHDDGGSETSWNSTEIVSDESRIADDHINLAVTPAGGVLAATKDRSNNVNLFYRNPGGGWEGPYEIAHPATRGIAVYDEDNDEVYVLYTNWGTSPNPISYKKAPLNALATFDVAPEIDLLDAGGVDLNDVTSTRQAVNAATGLVAAAKADDGFIHHSCLSLGARSPSPLAIPSPLSGEAPLTVDFMGTASDDGTIVSWSWQFGDGASSSLQNPQHTYAGAGIYNGSLLVTDDDGFVGVDTFQITVTPAPIGEVLRFNFQPAGAIVPTNYVPDSGEEFNGSVGWSTSLATKEREVNPDQRLDTYAYVSNSHAAADWEYVLANGEYLVTVVAGSPAFSAVNHVELENEIVIDSVATTKSFVEVIDHPVTVADGRLTMTIGGIGGSKKTKVCYLIIKPVGGPPPSDPPTATATPSTTSGDAPLIVDFTGAGSDDGTIVAWFWEFGDGNTSSTQSPQHTYTTAGTYNGRLMVTDDDGLTGEDFFTITVSDPPPPSDPPTATATPSTTSGEAPLVVDFTGAGSDDGTIVSWFWEFGDGNTSSEQSPQHTYTGAGTFNGRLTVTDDDGLTGEDLFTITVSDPPPPSDPPTAIATPSTTVGDAPLLVNFVGDATDDGTIVSYFWEFGDGNTSSEQSPTHTYTTPGTYNGKLTVTDDDGLTGEDLFTIMVMSPPPPSGAVLINFQPDAAIVPAGYTKDAGAEFAGNFGWSKTVTTQEREFNADQRLDTYAYVRNSKPPVDWEHILANGDYIVTVVAGSPLHTGEHHVELEGIVVIDGVLTDRSFVEVTQTVTVTDGRLTMTIGGIGGGKKTKVCYITITPTGS